MAHKKFRNGALVIAIGIALYFVTHLHILIVTNNGGDVVTVNLVTLGQDHRHLGEMQAGERQVLVFYKGEGRDLGYTMTIEANGAQVVTKDCAYISRFPTIYEAYIRNDAKLTIVCRKRV